MVVAAAAAEPRGGVRVGRRRVRGREAYGAPSRVAPGMYPRRRRWDVRTGYGAGPGRSPGLPRVRKRLTATGVPRPGRKEYRNDMRYTRKHLPAALFRTLAALALLAATAYALVPSGDGAQAQTCPDAAGQPTPTEIEVTAVPIVVESTTADYFVLYVSHYVDGATVEQPVRVVLGEDGGTTLAENVAALPNERYRVEKYLIADPADVDGDCTDDITELGDPVIKSPVNPAAITSFRYGAVAIPDQETFESLGEVYPSGRVRLKFILVDMDTGRPGVYFMNQNWFLGEHDTFLGTIGVERERATRGTVLYDPHVVAPGGSQGVYRFRIHDPRSSFSFFERANTLLAANLPLLDDNLTLWIRSSALPLIQPELPSFRASRLNLVFDDDVYGDTGFIALSQGEGYGLLRHMGPDDRASSRDVVIYETLPNELPRVAGIISTGPQTPLSHVNLRALQDGVPNAFIAGALDDETLDDLIDSYVHYVVAERGYTIRAASQSEVEAHHASSRPAEAQTPERDLSVTSVTPLGDIGFDDWDSFGVKAANVAVLGTLGFPEETVPDGFAVPFYFYDEFMKHNGFYDDIREMLADPDFQTDYDTKADELKKLRKRIKKAETPEWIVAALAAMHASYPEGTSLRYRSSTNNEDLPGFNGAGLYDSKTQHPEETVEDGIDKSLKQVYASLWNFRALVERDFHRIDHLAAAMGVLVHPNYSDERVNGVAVSVAPSVGGDGSYYVNSQAGEDLVTNPEAHSVPEEAVLNADGTFTVVAFSNRAPPGQSLMTDDQLGQLRRHLAAIHERFAELYGIEDGEEFAMEIEFKITSGDVLAIKQARPWVFGGTLTGNFAVVPVLQTTLANGIDSSSAPPSVGYSIYEGIGALPDRSFAIDGRSYDIVFILQSAGAVHLGLSAASERSFTLQLDDEAYEARDSSTLNAVATYWWPNRNPTWSEGQDVGIAIAAAHPESALMPERAAAPPTARLRRFPGAHDGVNAFDVHLRITKPVLADAERMASHAIVVQGGAVEGARTTHKTTDSWLISVRPSGSDAVQISVAEASQCSDPEALCDSDGMMLHNHPRVLIPGPPPNNPATGAPGISGTAHVGQTLTASTSNIADADGLARVAYVYQWIRSDGTTDTDIAGQTEATYAPVSEDLGKSVKVRVSFTDDAGHEESLTSAATAAVEVSRDRPYQL